MAEATWPEALYLLASLAEEPPLRAWRIVDGAAAEVPLVVGAGPDR
jgi:hypothetical protein